MRETSRIDGFHGEPSTGTSLASTVVAGREIAPSTMSHLPYEPARSEPAVLVIEGREVEPTEDRSKRCVGNEDTCRGFRTKDSDLCAGHQRALAKEG